MMKCFATLLMLMVSSVQLLFAQYYHKDILSVQWATAEKNSWEQKKIKTVKVHSFEADRTASEGFFCEKQINKDFSVIETYTKAPSVAKALAMAYYNQKGLLVKATDSSEVNASTSFYEYDNNNNITNITTYSHSSDEDFITSLKEEHRYFYNNQGKPTSMLRIKNGNDTLEVLFKIDAKGNVTDEIEKEVHGRHYYYYYDDQNKLTDIAKYNVVKKRILPDLVFEYDSDGLVEKMTSMEERVSGNYYTASGNFYTWRYVYNEGLKIIEKCYERDKVLVGYFEYEYEYR